MVDRFRQAAFNLNIADFTLPVTLLEIVDLIDIRVKGLVINEYRISLNATRNIGAHTVRMLLAKNPAGWQEALSTATVVLEVDPEALTFSRLGGADQTAAVRAVSSATRVGDDIWVKCLGVDEKGRVKLSRKAAMAELDEKGDDKDAAPADTN